MAGLTQDQKMNFLELVKLGHTLKDSAKAVDCNYQQIKYERHKSVVFDRWIKEAQNEGRIALGDAALTKIMEVAFEENPKDRRAQLTAAMSLANYAVPGFRGESRSTIKVDHNVRVIGGPPRPQYKELPESKMEIIDVTPIELPLNITVEKKRGRPKKDTDNRLTKPLP